MTELMERLDALDAKADEAAALRADLRRSCLIKELWSEAFEKGSTTSWVSGHTREVLTFTIRRGDKSVRKFDLLDVPVELWTEEVKDHVRKWRGKYWLVLKEAE